MAADISIKEECRRVPRKDKREMFVVFNGHAAGIHYLFCTERMAGCGLYIDCGDLRCSYFYNGTC